MTDDDKQALQHAIETIRSLRRRNAELAVKAQAFDAICATIFHTRLPSQGAEPDAVWFLERILQRTDAPEDDGSTLTETDPA